MKPIARSTGGGAIVFAVVCAWFTTAEAGPRISANYAILTDLAGIGGLRAASASYKNDSSTSLINGISGNTAFSETAKHGYAAQLYEVLSLSITAPPSNNLNEGATRQLQAAPLLDDTTTLAPLSPSTVSWSIVSGPITQISSGGVASAATVYQDTSATVKGTAQNLTGQFNLTVLNVNTDDFGSYAGDGIDDAWQIQYFGQNNPKAAPLQDPDGDGENNMFEYVAGLVPTDPNSRFVLSISPVPSQPNQRSIAFSPRFGTRNYIVKSKANLSDATWNALTNSITTDNGNTRTVTDLNATGTSKLYHVDITKP